MIKIVSEIDRPDPNVIKELEAISPSDYGHSINFQLISARKIKPLFPIDGFFAGPAITVRIPPNDGLLINKALDLVKPGDVVVIDMNEEERFACWGEITTKLAMEKGAIAAIINGPVTDTKMIIDLQFKVFSYAISPLTTKVYSIGGDVNIPVCIQSCIINPGDIIVGSNDGLLVVPKDQALDYLEIGKKEQAADNQRRQDLEQLGAENYLRRFDPLWEKMVEKSKS
ncbi:RraA family protein [Bacillus sp. AFS055030]|uniref:RraA family protein n=1 Tax=Bacillus sp. AFS055030 TaxID=2033507 RepID=UPI000BFCB1AA|nr:RraA family protein [Bacillus sp. AFS055030]PGL70196.1 dimethylmenaquinone methyltransferase [Bacillus sp. AFS055030]